MAEKSQEKGSQENGWYVLWQVGRLKLIIWGYVGVERNVRDGDGRLDVEKKESRVGRWLN